MLHRNWNAWGHIEDLTARSSRTALQYPALRKSIVSPLGKLNGIASSLSDRQSLVSLREVPVRRRDQWQRTYINPPECTVIHLPWCLQTEAFLVPGVSGGGPYCPVAGTSTKDILCGTEFELMPRCMFGLSCGEE